MALLSVITQAIAPCNNETRTNIACDIVGVTGTINTYPFLESFLSMYKDNPTFRDGLLVALMSAFVSKANGHPHPKFSVDAVSFFIAVEATSRNIEQSKLDTVLLKVF